MLYVLNDLKNRAVQNVLIFCAYGLNGFKEAIWSTFQFAKIQRLIIHQIKSSMKYIPYKDRKVFVSDLKSIHKAVKGPSYKPVSWTKKFYYDSLFTSWMYS